MKMRMEVKDNDIELSILREIADRWLIYILSRMHPM